MSATRLIARDELRLMARNRVAVIAAVLLLLLTLAAVVSSWSHHWTSNGARYTTIAAMLRAIALGRTSAASDNVGQGCVV